MQKKKKIQKEDEKWKEAACKRKLDEIRAEEKSLHEKLEQLKAEQTAAQKAMEKVISCADTGQKINIWKKVNDMMEIQTGNKLKEFGRLQQSEGNKKLRFQEKEAKLQVGYSKLAELKNLNLEWKWSSETLRFL